MDDLIGIVVMILYFVALGAAGKNKKKKKAKQAAARKQEVQFEQAFERIAEAVLSGERRRGEKKPSAKAAGKEKQQVQEGMDPCHEAMLAPQRPSMRLHTVTQEGMRSAGEGEDPCHLGDAQGEVVLLEDSPVYRSPIFDTEDKDAFAKDILRGIVMSEVLTRPAQRRMGRSMKRGA